MYKDDLLVGKNAECTLKGESYVILLGERKFTYHGNLIGKSRVMRS